MNKKNAITLLLVVLYSIVLFGQKDTNQIFLKDYIKDIENRHNYFFSFDHTVIDNIVIPSPSKELTFNEVLDHIETTTDLTTEILENNIAILKQFNISFCGYLLDGDTALPISNASVFSKLDKTITNEAGYFELQASKKVRISHVIYKEKIINVAKRSSCDTINLEMQINTFDEVVITPFLTKGISKRANGLYEIDYNKFGILPGLTENDALQTISALPNINTTNENVSNLSIRGGTHDQNLFMLNGIRVYQTGHFFGLISSFSPYFVDKVTIQSITTNPSYTDAASGSIALKTTTKEKEKLTVGAHVNLINADVFGIFPVTDKTVLKIASRRSYNELLNTSVYDNYFRKSFQNSELYDNSGNLIDANTSFFFYDNKIHLNHKFNEQHNVELNFINSKNKILFNESAFIDQNEVFRENRASQKQIGYNLTYNRELNQKSNLTVSAYNVMYTLEAYNNILNNEQLFQTNNVKELDFKVTYDNEYWSKINTSLGYELRNTQIKNKDEIDGILTKKTVNSIYNHALFLTSDLPSIINKLKCNLGTRLNYYQRLKKVTVAPKLVLSYLLNKNHKFYTSAAVNNQIVSQVSENENSFLGIENRRWVLSNDNDIPIINSKQVSFGWDYNHKKSKIGIEGYLKKVDGITTMSQGFRNQLSNSNTSGSYFVKGVDLYFMKSLKRFNTWLAYTLSDNSYTFESLTPVSFRNNLDIRHRANITISYKHNKLSSAFGLNWNSAPPTTLVENQVFNSPNSNQLSPFLRLDFSLKYKLNISNKIESSLAISILNIFDKKNILNTDYEYGSDNQLNRVDFYSLERTFNISYKIFFKNRGGRL